MRIKSKPFGVDELVDFMAASIEKGGFEPLFHHARDNAITDQVGVYTIDTTHTLDQGWETGISPDNENTWHIVQHYPTAIEAAIGHRDWIKKLIENPDITFEKS